MSDNSNLLLPKLAIPLDSEKNLFTIHYITRLEGKGSLFELRYKKQKYQLWITEKRGDMRLIENRKVNV